MRNDYFESDEFKSILEKYEASEKQGIPCYFDAEDFMDLADNYLLADRPDDTLRVLELAEKQHPNNDDIQCVKSGTLIYLHRYSEAREIINSISSDNNGNALYQRAQLAYALDKDVDTAEELFTDWIEFEENASKHDAEEDRQFRLRDAYLHVLTSLIELSDGGYDEEIVKRWVEEYYARFSPLGGNDCDLSLADMVRNEGLSDMVEKIYASLLEYDPYINYGWTVLSAAQVVNGHYKEALESVEFALAIDPENMDAILNKAHAYYSTGEKDKALPLFEKFLAKYPDPNQYLPYAVCLITQNRGNEAEPYLKESEEFVLLHKEHEDYYCQSNYELAEAYLSILNLERALDCIHRTLDVCPKDADCLLLEGTIHLANNDIHNCIMSFTSCIRNAVDKVMATCSISLRFILQGQEQIALQILDTADEYGSSEPSYRFVSAHRALAYLQMHNIDEFLKYFKQASEECPDMLQTLFYDKFPSTVEPKDYYNYIVSHPFGDV